MAGLDIGVIIIYFVVVIGVGLYYSRRSSRDLDAYFLGGKKLHWSVLAMSGAVSNFDVTGTMWMVSVLYLLGMKSWWHHWMWGVMLPAFGLAYMARWVRRSGVITGAEWMRTRFGPGGGGLAARLVYALAAVITCASFIGYAFQGIGKFATVYIPLEGLAEYLPALAPLFTIYKPQTLAVVVLGVTTLYVVMGGLIGVVVTDVIQTVVLTAAAALIVIIAYIKISPEAAAQAVPAGWDSLWPVWRIPELSGTIHAEYEMFGLMTLMWVIKGLFLNAGGPGQMYDFQRYLAARDPVDASKLAAAWPLFLVARWAMVAAITLLALTGAAEVSDPELVMPTVLSLYLPVGLKGLVIAGLLSAFMSTFSSTANSGASYIIRDLWQPLLAPDAAEKTLIRGSYLATVGIVIAGMVIGFFADSITSIWNWIMMALGGAVIAPNLLRWYWWRTNGWGYAAGALAGIILSIIALVAPGTPLYVVFPIICAGSLAAAVIGSLATPAVDSDTLASFYASVRPFGWWGPVKVGAPAETDPGGSLDHPARAVFNTVTAVVGITGLYLAPMYGVGHFNGPALVWSGIAAAAGGALYFTWYRRLGEGRREDPNGTG